jgi:hypothetical protein
MSEKTLRLIFQNQGGGTVVLAVRNVREDVTDAEVKAAMEAIIAKNIFDSNGGDLTSVKGAEIVTRSVQELAVA